MIDKIFIFAIVILSSTIAVNSDEEVDLTFPPDFLIGTATSAYQVEAAWNVDGKESIWDHFLYKYPRKIKPRARGDISVDFYHNYPQDIQLLKDIGFDHFSFSISWDRIFPNGYAVNASAEGIRYYHNILDELEKQQIIPFVTIYHWDHPRVLDKIGGWLNKKMACIYADYAKFIFKEFGKRVKVFITINEPNIFCKAWYNRRGNQAPAGDLPGYAEYLCVQNMLKAHALAYRAYNKHFRKEQGGIVGIVTACAYGSPKNENDTTTADIYFDFDCGWVMNPIFSKTGDYPEIMKSRIKERSLEQGYEKSRFPVLTKSWKKCIRGSADYFGLNYYTSFVVEPEHSKAKIDWASDSGIKISFNESWPFTDISWMKVMPEGLGNLLRKIKNTYNNPTVFILENGVADNSVTNDTLRINYLYLHMKEVLTAIKRDNCDVKVYTIWSFLDSLGWSSEYIPRFGLVDINYYNNYKRTPKQSAWWVKSLLKSRKLHLIGNST